MARNYKTGAARNRRRPDPGGPPTPSPNIYPTRVDDFFLSAGQINLVLTMLEVGSVVSIDEEDLILTGLASTAELWGPNENGIPPTSVEILSGGYPQFVWVGTFNADDYRVILNPFDRAFRGTSGQWLGPVWAEGTLP